LQDAIGKFGPDKWFWFFAMGFDMLRMEAGVSNDLVGKSSLTTHSTGPIARCCSARYLWDWAAADFRGGRCLSVRGCKNPSSDILSVYKIVLSDFLKNPAVRNVL